MKGENTADPRLPSSRMLNTFLSWTLRRSVKDEPEFNAFTLFLALRSKSKDLQKYMRESCPRKPPTYATHPNPDLVALQARQRTLLGHAS